MARQPRRGLYNALQGTQPATPGAQRSTLQASPAPAQRTTAAPQPARPPMSGSPSPAAPRYPQAPSVPNTTQTNPGYLGQTGQVLSQGYRNLAQGQTNRADATLQQARQPLAAAQGTYQNFEGPIQQSPFYKALYNTGVESTSSAYDAADAAMKARANAAGFGYAQPVTQGAEGQLRSQEAEALARVPEQATLDTAPLALEAAQGSAGVGRDVAGIGQTYAGIGANQGQLGLGYFDAANKDVLDQALLNQQQRASRSKLWSDLFNLQPGSGGDLLGAAVGGGY
jgi:hypothetical protein